MFLLTDEKDIATWNKFRENLKVNANSLLKPSPSGTNAVESTKSSECKNANEAIFLKC